MANIITINGITYALAQDGCFHPVVTDEKQTAKRSVKAKGNAKPTARKGVTGVTKATTKVAPTVEFELDGKTVTATGWLPHAVYAWNKAECEKLGGMVQRDSVACSFVFTTAGSAKKFAKIATTTLSNEDYKSIVDARNERKAANPKRPNKDIAAVIRSHNAQPVGEIWENAKTAYDANGLDGVHALFAPAKGKGRGRKTTK